MVHCSQLHISVIELDLIQHSAWTDNMLCINSSIIYVSPLHTSVCWQEKEDFDVGSLGFFEKNGESETLPFLKWESGWRGKWHFVLISHSANEVNYCCQHMHYLILHIPHVHTHTQTHTLGDMPCLLRNQHCVKANDTIWCWYTTGCQRQTGYEA